jgi:hypothetical protein
MWKTVRLANTSRCYPMTASQTSVRDCCVGIPPLSALKAHTMGWDCGQEVVSVQNQPIPFGRPLD